MSETYLGNNYGGVVGPYADCEIQPRLRANALGYVYVIRARNYREAQVILGRQLNRERRASA